jgi:hypothetical protein
MFYNLGKERPDVAARIAGAWLDRLVVIAKQQGNENPFESGGGRGRDIIGLLQNAASAAPALLAKELLPRIVNIVRETEERTKDGGTSDRIWPWFFFGDSYQLKGVFLECTSHALSQVAVNDPDTLDELTRPYESLPHETIAFLLLRAWTENGERYADRVAEFLLADRHRLNVGYDGGWSEGDGQAAVTRAALAAITPHCSSEAIRLLESAIYGFSPKWEKGYPPSRGRTELSLWRSMSADRLSERSKLRIEELERKFPNAEFKPPFDRGVQVVGPPISPDRAIRMNDDQWVSAMVRYPENAPSNPNDFFRGGAHELSRVLETEVREYPQRFVQLVDKMPDTVSPVYFSTILDALSRPVPAEEGRAASKSHGRTPGTAEMTISVIRRLHSLPGRPCGRSICYAIGTIAKESLPTDIIGIAAYYAQHDPDPEREVWQDLTEDGRPFYGGDAHFYGINTTRGAAARAIAALLFAESGRRDLLLPAIERLATDNSLAVRSCAAEACLAVMNLDQDRAVALFLSLCSGADPILWVDNVITFLRYAIRGHYLAVRPILQRMLSFADPRVLRAGAQQTCLAGLVCAEAVNDAAEVRSGSEDMRCEAATVYAMNLTQKECRVICSEMLCSLFRDESEAVRKAAAACFRGLRGSDLRPFAELIREFIRSPSFETDPGELLDVLEETPFALPNIVCEAVERFVAIASDEAKSIAYEASHFAMTASKLVVRLYEQSTDDSIRSRCLDMIDKMEERGLIGVTEALSKLER